MVRICSFTISGYSPVNAKRPKPIPTTRIIAAATPTGHAPKHFSDFITSLFKHRFQPQRHKTTTDYINANRKSIQGIPLYGAVQNNAAKFKAV